MKVLLLGIDGVRHDILERTDLPSLDGIAARGGLKPLTIGDEAVTISGPMWSTILTGTWPHQHGVTDNVGVPETRVRDLFTRLIDAGEITEAMAASSWPPITSRIDCGPIIDPSVVRVFTSPLTCETIAQYEAADAAVRDAAVMLLSEPLLEAAFVYFGVVDAVGHEHGVGEEYVAAIRSVDARIGDVLRALDAREDRDDWIVLATTDHGHLDAGGHGGYSPEECEIWVISDRADLLAEIASPIDIAPAIERAVRGGNGRNRVNP